ncbi:alanine--glyoxylate aminotransferase family protein [Dissulfurirhabdus thermomarina]|uniref:Alanine--glyoxylate aminotransferase family protein n=1 Tax=Dissulfurirhabdus thermomarina TaxID=1765737 RepID=A0A6N9TR47_DISTH|nr:alanine--glyoxylate aminotransferase family protein [Dissulfurirhabdus thermomarina]NDY42920.1 alanine--glyoxylate aminotransferase family protein [Dissulfurirhabdus thermomarina]NMX23425.1 alanine--glyoxylate aminotransferase family protein [Dissulfurirhabdus thermomarina]
MRKRYLMAPGPVAVAPDVLLKMAEPIIHHRSPQFSAILEEVRGGLKYLFQTRNDVLVLASSGTGGMEASVANLCAPGDTAVVVRGGKFGERWAELCEAYGVRAVNVDVAWGRAVDPADVAAALEAHPEARAVFVQAHETSTGVKHPVEALGELVRPRPETVLVVDAISALGVYDIRTDDWGLDVVVTGSQKSLGLPPGLAMVSVSEKAWALAERSTQPRYYFDFRRERKALGRRTTAFTPAVSLIIGLERVLARVREVGLPALFAHHRRLAEGTRAGVRALGLSLFPEAPSEAVTVIRAPEGIDGQEVVKLLREEYGITIAGGQAQAKGKIFRISHMGHLDEWDMLVALAAVERALHRLGHPVELGRGVAAAEAWFAGAAA